MLSLFPDLLDWSWYVPLAFRVFLGAYCCYVGWTLARNESTEVKNDDRLAWMGMRALLLLLGLLLVLGVAVQALGAIGFALALFAFFLRTRHFSHTQESLTFYLLIGIVSLSLIFLGPGPYSFDLPL